MFSLTEITNADLDNIQNDSDQEIGDQNEHSNEGDLLKGIDNCLDAAIIIVYLKELEDFWTKTFT